MTQRLGWRIAALILVATAVAQVGFAQTTTGVNLLGASTQPPAGNVAQGQTNYPALGFGLQKAGIAGNVGFTGIVIRTNLAHTAQATDLTAVKIARDANLNGQIDAGETIQTISAISFPMTFNAFSAVQQIPNAPQFSLYIVGVDVAAGAVASRVISLQILNNTDVTTNPVTTVTGAPVVGNNHTIVAPSGAEIDVQRPAGTSIPSGNTDNIGNVQVGTPTNFQYTILNAVTATGSLQLTGTPRVDIPAITQVNCSATVTVQPPVATIPAGSSTTFTVQVTPSSAAAFSFFMTIANNDSNENPYNINVQGTGTSTPVPTISVSTSTLPLGTTTQGTASTPVTYTVSGSNLTANIAINAPANVELSSSGAGGPYLTSLNLVQSGGTVPTTTIHARIMASAPAGNITGNITHTSTGATTQNVAVTGTVNAASTPAINVSTASVNLGTTTQGIAGTPANYTVSGSNLTANISINAPTGVELSSTSASGPYNTSLTLTQSGGAVATTTIYARIAASASVGAVSGNITHSSTGATTQNVSVSGTVNAATPEMDVTRGATPVADGAPSDALGTVPSGVAQTVTYTIANSGSGALNLTGTPLVAVTPVSNITSANVTTLPTTPVAGLGSTTFTITYTVTSAAAFSFTISIDNNDASENPYNWTATGTGATNVPELDVSRGATPVLSGSTDSIGSISAGSASPVSYTLANTGTATLNISAAGATAGTNCTVSVTTAAPATIAAGNNAPFVVSVTPTAAGAFDFTVTITNDDPSESTYTFTVSGTATTAGGGGGGGGGGSDGGGCSTAETAAPYAAACALMALVAGLRLRRRRA